MGPLNYRSSAVPVISQFHSGDLANQKVLIVLHFNCAVTFSRHKCLCGKDRTPKIQICRKI